MVPDKMLGEAGRLDPVAIAELRDECWPDVRDEHELHDLLCTLVVVPEEIQNVARGAPLAAVFRAAGVAGPSHHCGARRAALPGGRRKNGVPLPALAGGRVCLHTGLPSGNKGIPPGRRGAQSGAGMDGAAGSGDFTLPGHATGYRGSRGLGRHADAGNAGRHPARAIRGPAGRQVTTTMWSGANAGCCSASTSGRWPVCASRSSR